MNGRPQKAEKTMENTGLELIELKNRMENDRENFGLGDKPALQIVIQFVLPVQLVYLHRISFLMT